MGRAALVITMLALCVTDVASAKETVSATICGAGGCRTIETFPDSLTSVGGTAIAGTGGPHYEVTIALARNGKWTIAYYPEAAAIRHVSESGLPLYTLVDFTTSMFFRDATRGLKPFDAQPADAGLDWPLVTGSLIVAFGLALTAALLPRRGRRPRPA